jgi:hypothetical protein
MKLTLVPVNLLLALALCAAAGAESPLQGFDALVISLPNAHDRRKHMNAFLSDSGLLPNYTVIDAFGIKEGKLSNPEDAKRLDDRLLKMLEEGVVTVDDQIGNTPGFKTDGELGIALSQATALMRVVNAPSDANQYTIIFEDDVGLYLDGQAVGDVAGNPEKLAEWSGIVSSVVSSAKKNADWDVLFLGYCLEYCEQTEPGPTKEMLTAVRPLW